MRKSYRGKQTCSLALRGGMFQKEYLQERNIREEDNLLSRTMHIKPIIAIALIISAALMAAKLSPEINTEQFREGKYIHIDSVVIVFDKSNANVDVEYRLSPFAEAYMFLFGSKNLEPKIKEIFANFTEVNIRQIGSNSASLQITNISRKKDQYFLHDSRKFGMQPDVLTLVYPDSTRKIIPNPKSTPDVFYT